MKKQRFYLSEFILWEMICDIKAENPNDTKLGEKVRELVNKYHVPQTDNISEAKEA